MLPGAYALPVPPSLEEQAAIKRREKALDAQPWFRAHVEKALAERRAKRAAKPSSSLKAPALSNQN